MLAGVKQKNGRRMKLTHTLETQVGTVGPQPPVTPAEQHAAPPWPPKQARMGEAERATRMRERNWKNHIMKGED